jgi:hypothetical protein
MPEQGTLANDSGNLLEQTVKTVLSSKGLKKLRYREWLKNPEAFGKELLLFNVPFTSIYDHKGSTEFRLLSDRYSLDIRIECKWQQSAGSVDEKLPYLYLNCIEAMPEKHIIILIDGDGWKSGAIPWLKKVVEEKKYTSETSKDKTIQVMNLKEFITWANSTFR